MKFFIIGVFFFVLAFSATSATTNSQSLAKLQTQTAKNEAQTQFSTLLVKNDSVEVERLKDEIQLLKSFQSDILQTVYWGLGAVFALALLLLGYNWISANKMYERDRNALKEEIINAQKQAHVELETRVNSALNTALITANETSQRLITGVNEKLA